MMENRFLNFDPLDHREQHPTVFRPVQNSVTRRWCSYLSGTRCRLLAYGLQLMPLHNKTLSSLASFKSRLVLFFWYRLAQVVLENRPLNWSSRLVVAVVDLWSSTNYLCMAIARSSSGILICYILPVLWSVTCLYATVTQWGVAGLVIVAYTHTDCWHCCY